jgi:hypothetical protein
VRRLAAVRAELVEYEERAVAALPGTMTRGAAGHQRRAGTQFALASIPGQIIELRCAFGTGFIVAGR